MAKYNPNSVWKSTDDERDYLGAHSPQSDSLTGPRPASRKGPESSEKDQGSDLQTSGTSPSRGVASSKSATPLSSAASPDRPSFFARHTLLFFTLGLLLVVGFVGLVYYLVLPPPAPNIAISFSGPTTIPVGIPISLPASINNDSNIDLQGAILEVTLPPDLSFAGQSPSQRAMDQTIGTLSAGAMTNKTFTVIATGPGQTVEPIQAKLLYEAGTNTKVQYEADKQVNLTTSESITPITYSGPTNILSGQAFPITVMYANTSEQTLQGAELTMQYPPAFTFLSSSLPPANTAGTLFALNALAPNATGTITIMGTLSGPSSAGYQIQGAISAAFLGQTYQTNSQTANFLVTEAPLALTLSVNNTTSTYVASLGSSLTYTLTYANNSNVTFQNLILTATLFGSMYDFSTLQTSGAFSSRSNTVTWTGANDSDLLSLAPGQSGSVTFTVNTQKSFPAHSANNALQVSAGITSPTVVPNSVGSSTAASAQLASKISGQTGFSAMAYYYDSTSGFTNSGPYPPKVNQATTYTIHWNITNSADQMKNVTVSGYLQSGTKFVNGRESAGNSSQLTYNPANGLVSWTIPSVAPNESVSAVFQVSNTPAVNQVGQDVTLLGASTMSGTDLFTNGTVSLSARPVTTALPNDVRATGSSSNHTVTQ